MAQMAMAVVIAALYALSIGFSFDSDFRQVALRPFALGDGEFAKNDWFVGLGDYNWAFTAVVRSLFFFAAREIDVLRALYLGYVGLHFLFAIVSFGAFRDDRRGILAWLLMLGGLGGTFNESYYSFGFVLDSIIPSSVAAILFMSAFAFVVSERYKSALAFMGAAAIFHLNLVVLSAFVALALFVYLWRRRILDGGIAWAFAGLFVIFLILVGYNTWASSAPAEVKVTAEHILINVRAPHHYRIETFDLKQTFIAWAPVALAAASTAYSIRHDGWPTWEAPQILLFVILALAFANLILIVGFGWLDLSLLGILRFLPFAYFFCFYFIAKHFVRHLRMNRWSYLPVMAAAYLVLAPALTTQTVVSAVAVAIVAVGLAAIGFTWPFRQAVAAAAMAALIFQPTALAKTIVHKLASLDALFGATAAYRPAYGWLERNTSPGAVLLTDPVLDGVRFFTRRAIVVDWKCAPFLPGDLVEWYERLQDLTEKNIADFKPLSSPYNRKALAELDALAKRYGASHILVARVSAAADTADRTPIYRDSEFMVFAAASGG